jgi:hypothetical protein
MMLKEPTITLHIEGSLTAGYYNDMEAGDPVFIDGESVSDKIKDALNELGLDSDFCYGPSENADDVKNLLKNKKVKLTLEVFD